MPDLTATLLEQGTTLFSGRIDVDTKGLGGVVHMSEGQVLEAKLGSATGEPALWRMLLAAGAAVKVEPGKPRATSGAVLGKPEALLERWSERLEVLERVAEKVGGFDRVWAIRFDALRAFLEELPDAINPVLRLLDGKRSVRDVIAEAPLDDVLALRILSKLLSLGVLVLPDEEVGRISDAPTVVDVDEGLEAALTASLAEIEAEDEARGALEPIPLTAPRAPRGAPHSADAPATTRPAPSDASPSLGEAPDRAIPRLPAPQESAGSSDPAPSRASGEPRLERSDGHPGLHPPRDSDERSLPASTPPGPMPSPEAPAAPRDVTMRPGNVSFAPDTTLPVVVGLPSAPPIETNTELRSWLGSEEAFFSSTPRRTTDVPKLSTPWWTSFNGAWMLAILVVGIAAGMIIQLRACH